MSLQAASFEPLEPIPAALDHHRGRHRTLVDFSRAARLAKWKELGFGLWCSLVAVASTAIMVGCLLHGGWIFSLGALPFLLVASVGAWCGFTSARVAGEAEKDYRRQAAKIAGLTTDEAFFQHAIEIWNAAADIWWSQMVVPASGCDVGERDLKSIAAQRAELAAARVWIVKSVALLPGQAPPKSLPAFRL